MPDSEDRMPVFEAVRTDFEDPRLHSEDLTPGSEALKPDADVRWWSIKSFMGIFMDHHSLLGPCFRCLTFGFLCVLEISRE